MVNFRTRNVTQLKHTDGVTLNFNSKQLLRFKTTFDIQNNCTVHKRLWYMQHATMLADLRTCNKSLSRTAVVGVPLRNFNAWNICRTVGNKANAKASYAISLFTAATMKWYVSRK